MIAVMRGGLREDSLFDSAWQAISANVRFTAAREPGRDVATLLRNGRDEVRQVVENGADQFLTAPAGRQFWSLWDQSEDADKQFWMPAEWAPTGDPPPTAPPKPAAPATAPAAPPPAPPPAP